jgi:hypothetical protein
MRLIEVMRIGDGPPLLHFESLQLLNLNFDADPDPYTVFTLNADPDPVSSQNNADLRPDPQTWITIIRFTRLHRFIGNGKTSRFALKNSKVFKC